MNDWKNPETWFLRGLHAGRAGKYGYAVDCFKHAVSLRSDYVDAHIKLAFALRFIGRNEEAITEFRSALRYQPDNAEAGDGLAYLLFEMGRKEEAAECFRSTLRYHQEKAERYSAYGSVLYALGLCGDAIKAYETALKLNPKLNLSAAIGNCLLMQGRVEDAIDFYRQAIARNPGNVQAHSTLLMALNYLPDISKEDRYREHCVWGKIYGEPKHAQKFQRNLRESNRRLRIGYVSGDFRANHSVTYFIEPLLAGHDQEVFDVFCYSMMPRPDDTTRHLQQLVSHWRDIYGWDDARLADCIFEDGIDILVDLGGHTAANRLTAFTLKPAPIQVSYLGYPNTTALKSIDYRLTDILADPMGEDAYYTERLVRLPGCFLCYKPAADTPPVKQLPALQAGYVTFASFNNLAKVNDKVIELWCRILKAVSDSRLIIKYRALEDPLTRERFMKLFVSHGIAADRVEFYGHIPSRREHLALYGKVDIALDTFPYNGTTTTCEALWMGVPVMTLAGNTHAGRVGASLLNSIGLRDWVAHTTEDFVYRIGQHTADSRGLSILRAELRDRVAASPLCDGGEFVRNLEAAYRDMWRNWCAAG